MAGAGVFGAGHAGGRSRRQRRRAAAHGVAAAELAGESHSLALACECGIGQLCCRVSELRMAARAGCLTGTRSCERQAKTLCVLAAAAHFAAQCNARAATAHLEKTLTP